MELPQIIHQAIHPWPIHHNIQRLPCSKEEVLGAMLEPAGSHESARSLL